MQFKKKVLKNGLRVITIPMQDNPTVTVFVLVETGSKYESKDKNGISHFLEHMCFKGTERRPTAQMISRELDALGSHYNAFTSHEYTGYYAKSDCRHFLKIFDVVSDIYLNSTFPDGEIEKEKGVIVEEINMYEDMPQRHVQDILTELLYGDQPAGWNIAGTRENVRKMTRADFREYHGAHYLPEATTVIVSGNCTEDDVLQEVNRVFGKVENGTKDTKQKVKESQKGPEALISFKKTDQAHFVLGMRSFDTYHEYIPTLTVLATLLGGGMSSRLFTRLREDLGVAYYVRAEQEAFTDHGYLSISAGVSNARIFEVLEEVLRECARLTRELVLEDELSKVKEYLVGSMKLDLESSDAYATFYGIQEILRKDVDTPEGIEKKIRKVTSADIQTVAQKIFKDDRLNLAVIGPFQEKEPFTKILTFPKA